MPEQLILEGTGCNKGVLHDNLPLVALPRYGTIRPDSEAYRTHMDMHPYAYDPRGASFEGARCLDPPGQYVEALRQADARCGHNGRLLLHNIFFSRHPRM